VPGVLDWPSSSIQAIHLVVTVVVVADVVVPVVVVGGAVVVTGRLVVVVVEVVVVDVVVVGLVVTGGGVVTMPSLCSQHCNSYVCPSVALVYTNISKLVSNRSEWWPSVLIGKEGVIVWLAAQAGSTHLVTGQPCSSNTFSRRTCLWTGVGHCGATGSHVSLIQPQAVTLWTTCSHLLLQTGAATAGHGCGIHSYSATQQHSVPSAKHFGTWQWHSGHWRAVIVGHLSDCSLVEHGLHFGVVWTGQHMSSTDSVSRYSPLPGFGAGGHFSHFGFIEHLQTFDFDLSSVHSNEKKVSWDAVHLSPGSLSNPSVSLSSLQTQVHGVVGGTVVVVVVEVVVVVVVGVVVVVEVVVVLMVVDGGGVVTSQQTGQAHLSFNSDSSLYVPAGHSSSWHSQVNTGQPSLSLPSHNSLQHSPCWLQFGCGLGLQIVDLHPHSSIVSTNISQDLHTATFISAHCLGTHFLTAGQQHSLHSASPSVTSTWHLLQLASGIFGHGLDFSCSAVQHLQGSISQVGQHWPGAALFSLMYSPALAVNCCLHGIHSSTTVSAIHCPKSNLQTCVLQASLELTQVSPIALVLDSSSIQ
jgi:hypothetical protein